MHVIEIHDMLTVLTVDEVEKRLSEVPGVESATVNYSVGNTTLYDDEALLEVADIKVLMHQRGQQSAGEYNTKDESEDNQQASAIDRHDFLNTYETVHHG